MENIERLDVLVFKKQLTSSRNDAQKLIEAGKVKVNGKIVLKNHSKFDENANITIENENVFVSRAGEKLKKALEEFKIDVKNFICLDVGASTGGFTECLLNDSCDKVYSVDVGTDQLDEKLKKDRRVVNLEKTDIRSLEKLDELVDLITVDVAFISAIKIIPVLKKFLKDTGKVVLLVKPQFEIVQNKNKKGKVKDEEAIKEVLENVKKTIKEEGYILKGLIESPILGKKGLNKEYLVFFEN